MTGAGPVVGAPERELSPLAVDERVEAALREDGYAVIPLVGRPVVERLRRVHAELHPDGGFGFEIDLSTVSPEHRRRVHDALMPVWDEELTPHLVDPQFFMTTFAVKWPGESSTLPVHQDWSCVDERHDRSLVAWLALVDASPELGNGPLAVIPGSHRFLAPPRGANSIPWYSRYTNYLRSHLVPLSVRAGDLVLFDGRLVHGSEANTSDEPRVAALTRVAPRGTPLRYVNETPDSVWEFYDVDASFFIERGPLDLRARPPADRPVVGRRAAVVPEVDPQQIASLCGADEPPRFVERFVTRAEFLGCPAEGSTDDRPPGPSVSRRRPVLDVIRRSRRTADPSTGRAARVETAPELVTEIESALRSEGRWADASGATAEVPDGWAPCSRRSGAHHSAWTAPVPVGLAALLGEVVADPESCHLVRLLPGSRVEPFRAPGTAGAVVVRAARPAGAAVLRSGLTHVALRAGQVLRGGGAEIEVWNLSAAPLLLLVWGLAEEPTEDGALRRGRTPRARPRRRRDRERRARAR